MLLQFKYSNRPTCMGRQSSSSFGFRAKIWDSVAQVSIRLYVHKKWVIESKKPSGFPLFPQRFTAMLDSRPSLASAALFEVDKWELVSHLLCGAIQKIGKAASETLASELGELWPHFSLIAHRGQEWIDLHLSTKACLWNLRLLKTNLLVRTILSPHPDIPVRW